MTEYHKALLECGKRYREMLDTFIDDNDYWGWGKTSATSESVNALWLFIDEFSQGCNNELPLMKLNRWLGYIQGSLIQWGVTTVEIERDWTRPLFRPLDFPEEQNA
jgi:hypothetical protein